MAIGTTAAVLGSAAIGAGTSYLGSRSQSKAASQAAQVAQDNSAAQVALYRDIFNRQIQLNEPFRQFDIQRANAIGEIYGFDPVGQAPQAAANDAMPQRPAYQAPTNASYAAYRDQYPQRGDGAPQSARGSDYATPEQMSPYDALYARERADMNFSPNYVTPAAMTQGSANVQGQLPGASPTMPAITSTPNTPANNGAVTTTAQPNAMMQLINPQAPGADRFNSSLFAGAAQAGLNRDMDRIDASLGDGVFSGARQHAAANAAADRAGNALAMYMQGLGQPVSSPGTSAMTSAAGQYGANSGNAMAGAANAAMQSAYAQGNANANMWSGLGSAGGFALGYMK